MKYLVKELKRPSQDPISYFESQEMDAERFARWCISVCGGGYTSVQRKSAEVLQRQVDRHGKAYLRDFEITRLDSATDVGASATLSPMQSNVIPQARDSQGHQS